jgi:hypothetical protein
MRCIGAFSIFVGSCDDLIVTTTVPDMRHLEEAQGSFILGDGWSQHRS